MKNLYFIVALCLLSCKDADPETNLELTDNAISELITKEDVKALKYSDFMVDAKVEKIIGNWAKYGELNIIIQDLKTGNLSFFKSNTEIVATLNKELKATVPEAINSSLIVARVIAVETKIYKLESAVNLSNPTKESILEPLKELLVAFSNLNLQMNKQLEKESQQIQKPQ
ncbi:hypothetical protein BZARG_2056 [Bizionia argentinensis JUB59]|uniref:Uncharacterized protein n=1 Tax=Bizionia argentinensis JUB59 TaxID=1046627 RepID=G2EFC2_9FLAO|nr:hypothetical protein [Bizionia argentinensis]EGV42907.1 hypothetical protein BZARG_2056 [Bizionia argentinensis JUB59]